jgi:hypothetical protein
MTKHLVLASLENDDGSRCVDIFARADGRFGFEEYRRDPEDQGRWSPCGTNAHRVFATRAEAEAAARAAVAWLE